MVLPLLPRSMEDVLHAAATSCLMRCDVPLLFGKTAAFDTILVPRWRRVRTAMQRIDRQVRVVVDRIAGIVLVQEYEDEWADLPWSMGSFHVQRFIRNEGQFPSLKNGQRVEYVGLIVWAPHHPLSASPSGASS